MDLAPDLDAARIGAFDLHVLVADALEGHLLDLGHALRQVHGARDAELACPIVELAQHPRGAVVRRVRSDLDMVQALAHESAHLLLFGMCADGPLLENANDDHRYSSPLRTDSRPMDGIVHATFVTARMCCALSQLRLARWES